MKLNVETPKEEAVVSFINDREVVKIGDKYYPISYSLNDVETLYSLPSNDIHPPYTKRTDVKLQGKVKQFVNKHWTPFKEGVTIKGKLTNGIFHVER